VILPIWQCFHSFGELTLPVLAQRLYADCWKRDRASRVIGLGRHQAQRFADALERLDHFKFGPDQIDVLPPQAEQLSAPQTEEYRQDMESV